MNDIDFFDAFHKVTAAPKKSYLVYYRFKRNSFHVGDDSNWPPQRMMARSVKEVRERWKCGNHSKYTISKIVPEA